ncbi:hypothetical protein WJ968_33245 [Achromobacter xylosoxidans]
MRLLVVPAVQVPIFPSETVHAVADQRIGDAGFHGRGQLGEAWSAKADRLRPVIECRDGLRRGLQPSAQRRGAEVDVGHDEKRFSHCFTVLCG